MKKILFPLSLFVLTFLAFSPCLNAEFLRWDDGNHLVTNPLIYTFSPQNLLRIFAQTINQTYIPLTVLTYNIEYHIFGLSPVVVHLNNVLLHSLVAILIYQLGLRLGLSQIAAWAASAFFSLHPMHVESVAWATERKDVLYACFYLLALIQYWKYLETGLRKPFWCAVGFGLLSILSKPMAVSLPWILLLLDFYKGRRFNKAAFIDKIPFALTILPIASITFLSLAPHPKLAFPESFLVLTWSASFYLQKFIWPYPLLPLYTPPEPVQLAHPAYAGAIITSIIFIGLFIRHQRNRLWIFACLFFVGSNFFFWRFDFKDLNIVADRFMYLPSLGFCLFLGHLFSQWQSQTRYKKPIALILGALLLTLGTLTFLQCRIWQNGLSLWQWTINHEPHNSTARKKRALAPYNPTAASQLQALTPALIKEPSDTAGLNERGIFFLKNNNLTIALWDFNKAIALNPLNDTAYGNRGGLYQLKKEYKKALKDFDHAIKLAPKQALHRLNKGITLAKINRLDEAMTLFNQALTLNPQLDEGYYRRGLLLRQTQQTAQACADFNKAISLNATNRDFYYEYGLCTSLLRQNQEAIKAFTQALRINPWDTDSYNELGVAYIQEHQWENAMKAFNKVIELDLDAPKPYNNRGLIYLQLGRHDLALQDYSMSIRLNYAPYKSLITRGDIYVTLGETQKALADFKRAISINKEDTIARLKIANLYYRLGQYKKALQSIRQLLAIDPLNAEAHRGEIEILKALNQDK